MSYDIEKDWTTKAGLRAVVIMTDLGHRCGYVGIPKEHPLYGVSYNEQTPVLQPLNDETVIGKRGSISVLMAAVHGMENTNSPGMVFDVHGSLTFSGTGKGEYPVKSDLWWFGYDCGHAGDAPAPGSRMAQFRSGMDEVHRTLEYCIGECESLALQLAGVKADVGEAS
jgi:hypothetical protein